MNPGPLFIIRNHFYLLLLAFTFSALINFENTKIYLLLATTTKNPKRTLLYYFSLLSSHSLLSCYFIYCFIYCYFILFTRNLVLDNHTVELGAQGKGVVLQVVGRGWKEGYWTDPREFDINPRVTLVGKRYACYITLHLESQRIGTHRVASVIKTIFQRRCWGSAISFTVLPSPQFGLCKTPKLGEVAPL